jgi:hypothetical protein
MKTFLPGAVFMEHENTRLSNKAQKLIIKVTEKGRQMINLVLPARSICWISSLIPDVLADLLKKAGVDMAALEKKYQTIPISPGSVLALAMPEQDREVLFYLV